jgi:two-component system response regulator WspF
MSVGIVNDVRMAVEALRRVVTSQPDHEVAWVAFDGAEAAERCRADTPDVVLMDLIMPNVNGVEATRRIMRDSPCAILVVTASVEQNSSLVFDAMGQGALDAVNTPVLKRSDVHGSNELLAKLETIGKLLNRPVAPRPVVRAAVPDESTSAPLVAIGASTGGPLALVTVLRALPLDLVATAVIIQHVDVQFAAGLGEWLEQESGKQVRLVKSGATVGGPDVFLAGTNDHLVLRPDKSLGYVADPVDYPYRPSVDVFFNSVTAHWSGPAVGVLLTGMGRDGAEGLLAMRRAGWATIAQDSETSVVYGMPKAAADIGAAAEVLPIDAIAPAIVRALNSKHRSRRQSA